MHKTSLFAAAACALLAGCGSAGGTLPPRNVAPAALERAAAPAAGTGGLTYFGGPVQTAPRAYIVFWGASWNGTGDPNGVASYLKSFYGAIGGSRWLNTVTQYTQSNGQHVGNPTTLFGGSYVDTSSAPPHAPTQAQMAAEAAKAAAHFGVQGLNAGNYVVALPHGIVPAGFGTQYCAYHDTTTASGTAIAWTSLAYMPDAGTACGAGSVHSPGILDGVSLVAGGEQADVETDPQPGSGWSTISGTEITDSCPFGTPPDSVGGYPVPPLYSDALGRCV